MYDFDRLTTGSASTVARGMSSAPHSYTSLRSSTSSFVVLTGRNRLRGTTIAVAPSKTSIAAPMADSICTTLGLAGSFGSTVFALRMIGRPSTPPRSSSTSRST